MSEPKTDYKDSIQGALGELVSAMSALNMEPAPLTPPLPAPETLGRPIFLSESDGWAKHSYEHLRAAFELMNQAHTEREKLKTQVYRLELRVRDFRKGVHP